MGLTANFERRRRRRPTEDGSSAVEFALVAPLLIMLVFGVISFGMIFGQQLALGNAAREAARYGVVEGRTCAQIASSAQDAANTIGMSGTNVTVSIKRGTSAGTATSVCPSSSDPCKGSTTGDSIFVTLDFTSQINIPLVLTKSIGLRSDGVFRCEYS